MNYGVFYNPSIDRASKLGYHINVLSSNGFHKNNNKKDCYLVLRSLKA